MLSKLIKNTAMALFGGVVLSSVIACPLSAADCMIYDYDRSYIDQWGFMILRFHNSCTVGRQVNVCIKNEDGSNNNYSRWIPPGESAEVNIGQNVPQQTFYWTSDGTIPSQCQAE